MAQACCRAQPLTKCGAIRALPPVCPELGQNPWQSMSLLEFIGCRKLWIGPLFLSALLLGCSKKVEPGPPVASDAGTGAVAATVTPTVSVDIPRQVNTATIGNPQAALTAVDAALKAKQYDKAA